MIGAVMDASRRWNGAKFLSFCFFLWRETGRLFHARASLNPKKNYRLRLLPMTDINPGQMFWSAPDGCRRCSRRKRQENPLLIDIKADQ
jgi:hypothetical protein